MAADALSQPAARPESRPNLPYVSTVDAAEDMDVLRAALGDAKLTYLGFSYGSLLGATYAELFPTHVRAMVLDGVLDPALPAFTKPASSNPHPGRPAAGVLRRLHQVSLSVATRRQPHGGLRGSGAPGARQPVAGPGTSRRVGPSAVLWGPLGPSTRRPPGPTLAQALAGGQPRATGRTSSRCSTPTPAARADGSYSNILEANAAVNCLDTPGPLPRSIQADAPLTEKARPSSGCWTCTDEIECAVWPVPATGTIGPIRAAGSPPIVVVGSTGDPVTPYSWAQSLSRQLATGVLLTRVGDGHTAYGSSACIRTDVDRYLILAAAARGHPLPQRLSARLGVR